MTADYPKVWLLAFMALALLAGRVLPHGPGWLVWVGWLLAVAGLAIILTAALTLRRHATTVNPYGQPGRLVTSGPFSWSRNPIYLGDAVLIAGTGLIAGAPLVAVGLAGLFVLVIDRRFIPREEARLHAAFPAEFAAYSASTRRWI